MGDSTEWNGFPEPVPHSLIALPAPGGARAGCPPVPRRAAPPPPAPRAVAPPLTPVRPKTEGLTGLKDSAVARGPAPARPLP